MKRELKENWSDALTGLLFCKYEFLLQNIFKKCPSLGEERGHTDAAYVKLLNKLFEEPRS